MTLPHLPRSDSTTVVTIRTVLLGILLFGMTGILAELLLLEHTDGYWQIVPILLLATGIIVAAAHAFNRQHSPTIRVLQGLMAVFVVSGAVGTILHFTGNIEFERELKPTLNGFALLREAAMGATPALAPGAMVQLGLIGLLMTFRHPALDRG